VARGEAEKFSGQNERAQSLSSAEEPPPELSVHAFVGNPEFSGPRISDDGKTLAVAAGAGDPLSCPAWPR